MLETVMRWLKPRDSLKEAVEKCEADIVGRTQVVRDGVQMRFLERTSGDYIVLLERRTKPFLKATLMAEKNEAVAWRDDGEVPKGEISDLFAKFQLGLWPERKR